MQSSSKRSIRFLEVTIQAEDPKLVALDQYKLTRLLRKAELADFKVRETRDGAKRVVRVCDAYWFKRKGVRFVALLFSFADRDAIGATFEDLQTGDIEHHQKKATHGGRTEAHVVIKLKPKRRSGAYLYAAAAEATRGLGPGAISGRLTGPLRAAGASTVRTKSGKQVKTGPLVSIDGLISENLLQALEKGTPQAFDLVRGAPKSKGLDIEGELEFREEQMSFKATGQGFLKETWDHLRRVAKDNSYAKIRIRYKDTQGEHRTATVSDLDKDAFQQFIARKTTVTLSEPMDYNHVDVVRPFARALADVILKEAHQR